MRLTYPSRAKDIHIDVTLPPSGGRHPAIIVLHGSGGIHDLPTQVCDLPARGYVTVMPHYFESTDTSWATLDSIQQHGVIWGKTILDAVEFAAKLPTLAPASIGLMGFSLGGYLAVAVAANDRRMKCVVEFSGGAPEKFLPTIDRLPPTLILHGEDDRVVPVRHAMRLRQLCEEKHFPSEIEIYRGAGHNFSAQLMQTAMERATAFLEQQLKTPQPAACVDRAPS